MLTHLLVVVDRSYCSLWALVTKHNERSVSEMVCGAAGQKIKAATGAVPSIQSEKVDLAEGSGCTKWVPLADETSTSCLSNLIMHLLLVVYQGTQGIGQYDRDTRFKLNYTPCQHSLC